MAEEGITGGGSEPPKSGRKEQEAKGREQQARGGGVPQPRQGGRREGPERGGGLAARTWDPGALAFGRIASPFSFVRRMMEDLDRLFEELGPAMGGRELLGPSERGGAWSPSVDVFEREGSLVVRADLPGLGKDDVRVQVADGALSIEGERRHEEERERSGVYRSERFYGAFHRVIPLPETADLDSAEARFEDGVLEVTFRLAEEKARGRRIEIQEAKRGPVH